jgi:F0F1-type ATP synthase assembly protein I
MIAEIKKGDRIMKNQSGKPSDQGYNLKHRPVIKASLGLVFGAILGLIIGNMLGSQSLGLIFGAGLGLIFGAALDRQSK